MRAGLSTIQQTLTPEAATVLNHSIAEAGRRNHGQTTPLHVAATLLASPSGFLRQACIKSHPNSSHPLQCRALELCFSVALERLPTAQNATPGMEPPISNALMAALKRAQAHQRRGCPEQQQQPLLAVKVELEQLVISILDDPSVSRVMREASFSSPAVKATIEQSLNSSASTVNSSPIGLGYRPGAAPANRNLYLNPRLQQNSASQSGQQRGEDVKRVLEILLKSKKRNPVLVGESEPEAVVKEVLRRIESKEFEGVLKNVQVIRLEKEIASERVQMASKISELGGLIEMRIGSGGIILDLGDLKWLVEQALPQQQVVSEARRVAVTEMAKLVAKFGAGRLWLIGTATCETYLRCQVYHPSMENDWDLHVLAIAARAPLPVLFPRLGTNKIPGTSMDSLSPLRSFSSTPAVIQRRLSENLDPSRKLNCCPECLQNYEQELAKLPKVQTETAQSQLPQWLQNAKAPDDGVKTLNEARTKDQEMNLKQKIQELQKKWKDMCLRNHPNFHQQDPIKERIVPAPLSVTSFYNQNLLARQPFQPKLQLKRNLGENLQLNTNLATSQPASQTASPPGSPVRTELVLGRSQPSERSPEDTQKERTRDFLGCIPTEPQDKFQEFNKKLLSTLDADYFKRLLKGLAEKVWWQQEAASSVATAVTQCKMGNGQRRSKGDIWLFFTGPDRVGKRKMASTLAQLVNGTNPVMISLGSQRSDGEPDMNFRGKTALDRIVEAVRRNHFSVIMLEDIDEADMLLRGSIEGAMERGRLTDSYGREISLGNVIFIVTANWLPGNAKCSTSGQSLDDEKLESLASSGLQLRLSLYEKTAKRRANWLHDENRSTKFRKERSPTLSFDLNEAVNFEDDRADGSRNSSDLTIDHEGEHVAGNWRSPITSPVCRELLKCVDDAIVFKPVELIPIQREIASSITKRFSSIMGEMINIEVQDNTIEKVLAGLWLSQRSLEEWIENALVPSFRQLKLRLPSAMDESMVIRLEMEEDSERQSYGNWLPNNIRVVTNGV